MSKGKWEKISGILLPVISVALLLAVWSVTASAVGNGYVLPSVSETVSAVFDCFSRAEFYSALFGTLVKSVIAFAVSYLLALFTAVLSVKSGTAEKLLSPVIIIVRALPTIAVALLLTVWTSSRVAPVVVTTLVVFPTLHENIFSALKNIDGELTETCAAFGVDKKTTLKKVIFPQIAPPLISAAGSGLTLNLKLMVAAEVLSHTARCLGYMLNTAKVYFETAEMMALVLITVVIGLIIGSAFAFASKKAVKG